MNQIKIETIFDLMKNKDARGFELLYQNYFRTIYGIAFSMLKNEQACQDTVQNVMIKLYQLQAEKYPSSHEMSWLYTVTKNEALMLLRKEKSTINLDDAPELPVMDAGIEDYADMERFYSIIAPLSERQQKVIAMKILGGMSHREIAEVLESPIGTLFGVATPPAQIISDSCAQSHIEIRCPNLMYTEQIRICTVCGEDMAVEFHTVGDCDSCASNPWEDGSAVENVLLSYLDSEKEAKEIAASCGITLDSYDSGLAVYQVEGDPFAAIEKAAELGCALEFDFYVYAEPIMSED